MSSEVVSAKSLGSHLTSAFASGSRALLVILALVLASASPRISGRNGSNNTDDYKDARRRRDRDRSRQPQGNTPPLCPAAAAEIEREDRLTQLNGWLLRVLPPLLSRRPKGLGLRSPGALRSGPRGLEPMTQQVPIATRARAFEEWS